MPAKEKSISIPSASSADDRQIAPLLAALNRYIKTSTSSVSAATKSLKGAGILDRKGRVHKRFKS